MSIRWITGNSKSGKSRLALEMRGRLRPCVVLDGDVMRGVWPGLGLSAEDRREQCLRVARLARLLSAQQIHVIVAVIAPYRELRDEVQRITGCRFVYLLGGHEPDDDYPYEYADGMSHQPGRFEPAKVVVPA